MVSLYSSPVKLSFKYSFKNLYYIVSQQKSRSCLENSMSLYLRHDYRNIARNSRFRDKNVVRYKLHVWQITEDAESYRSYLRLTPSECIKPTIRQYKRKFIFILRKLICWCKQNIQHNQLFTFTYTQVATASVKFYMSTASHYKHQQIQLAS